MLKDGNKSRRFFLVLERSGAEQTFFFMLERSGAGHFFLCRSGAERSRKFFCVGAEQEIFFGVGTERSGADIFFWYWSGAERSSNFFLVLERSGAEQ